MSCNRKTLRFLKLEKSSDFARRKNEVEDKMLDTKLKFMSKEERHIRQKLYEIRREKYSRSFYKSPDRPKFIDVKVCETDEGEKNKPNLITASGVERTKCALRRKSIAVEEYNPGQVVRVSVSSKLEDKVSREESPSPCALPTIAKPKKRRYSVAIVTDVAEHNVPDLFAFEASYMQSISEATEETNLSKDDLCFNLNYQKKHPNTTLDELHECAADKTDYNIELSTCSEKLRELRLQTKLTEEPRRRYSLNDGKLCCNDKKLCSGDSCSPPLKVSTPEPEETKPGVDSTLSTPISPKRKVVYSDPTSILPSQRPQSSRSYSDGSLQEPSIFRKCSTPILCSSRKHSRARSVGSSNPSALRLKAESMPKSMPLETDKIHKNRMGYKGRPRSVSLRTGPSHQDSVLTEKEEKVAEQIMIRQLEIKNAADKMRKLSLQHFGDSKNTMKVPRRQSYGVSPYVQCREGLENAQNEANNNTEGSQRPGIVGRKTDNPQLLRKFVKLQCKNEKGKTAMEQVLNELSWDMPDCRYLRCSDRANDTSDCKDP